MFRATVCFSIRGFYFDLKNAPAGNLALQPNDNGITRFVKSKSSAMCMGFAMPFALFLRISSRMGGTGPPPGDRRSDRSPVLFDEPERDDDDRIMAVGRLYLKSESTMR